MTDLEKRVIDAREKRQARLKANYYLARSYGYSSEESSLLMNQSSKNIIANAENEGRVLTLA